MTLTGSLPPSQPRSTGRGCDVGLGRRRPGRSRAGAGRWATGELVDGPPSKPEKPALYYGSVDEFMCKYLRHAYKRKIDGKSRVWAARWWEYDEAVIRLEALWRSWEFLRRDPATGMSVWWRDHADHHMGMLMDPQGPFSAADTLAEENQAGKGAPLPYVAPPQGLFPDMRLPAT